MAYHYRSTLCKNCGRDKKFVGSELGSTFMEQCETWLNIKYCQECAPMRCKEPLTSWNYNQTPPEVRYSTCANKRMVAEKGVHPAVYRDYCEEHWPYYAFCHKRSCKAPKQVWRDLCDKCAEEAEATRIRGLNRKKATAARLAKEAEPKRWDPYKYVRKQARLKKLARKQSRADLTSSK